MAQMPRGEPFSVPDPLAKAWDAAARLNRQLQAKNDPLAGIESRARPPSVAPGLDAELFRAEGVERLAGGSGNDHSATGPSVPRQIDPSRTDVFRRGPDGKLHPITGWHTTGPFAFGEWAHNIDWGGVLRDVVSIAAGAAAGGGTPGLASRMGALGVTGQGLTAADGLTLGAGAYKVGEPAVDDLVPRKKIPHK
jgi:hypothetical protein